MGRRDARNVAAPTLDVGFRAKEALSTAVFAVALPVAAIAEAEYLAASSTSLAAILLIGAATALSAAFVYGRIESLTREMNAAADAVLRLQSIGDTVVGPALTD